MKQDIPSICDELALSKDARALGSAAKSPIEFVRDLATKDLTKDAVRVLARALPKRSAVWWGCLCIWHVKKSELSQKSAAGLRAAVRWVQNPAEPQRQVA